MTSESKYLYVFFISLFILTIISTNNIFAIDLSKSDTGILNNRLYESMIDEVIKNDKTPAKEKVEIVGEFTKYGFRNLFTAFNYNSSLPYSSQVNPHAELYMSDYLKIHSAGLQKMKNYAAPYFRLIENILKEYGLPVELKYLAVIESGLNKSATSVVGAAGPWQFMPATARSFGLQVNNLNDERRDYYKSTHAAARMLLKLYRDLNDWLLVIAAYNGGAQKVFRAINKTGTRDFWKLQYHLPTESKNHVKKFIATHYIMESKQLVLNNVEIENRTKVKTLEAEGNLVYQEISGKYIAEIIAKQLEMKTNEFEKYNPSFNKEIMEKGTYMLVLPDTKMEMFLTKKYTILQECVERLINESP